MSYIKMEELLSQEISSKAKQEEEEKRKIKLEATMRKAQIPGVSIAYLSPEGGIFTQELGLTDGCGLLEISSDPTKRPFNDLVRGTEKEVGIGTKNAVVLFNNDLYYVNQQTKSVQKIQQNEENKSAFEKLRARFTQTYQLANAKDHQLIKTLTDHAPPTDVLPETRFGAASLSKPVFAYLVQQLIARNKDQSAKPGTGQFILPEGLTHFDLDTPLSLILPLEELEIDGMPKFDMSDKTVAASAETLTARMVLSHTTGLAHGEMKFQFIPNPEEIAHGYSNLGIIYLQQAIEKLTLSDLETLAKKHVFKLTGMTHSTYIPRNPTEPAYAANTLRTTAKDYARFVKHLLNDKSVESPFEPHVLMTNDKGQAGVIGDVKNSEIPATALEHVAWGLGWGLQIEGKEAITAYHSGDMNDYRAWVAINLKDKNAVVFFANSHNGHVLAEQIIPETIQINHAANYFFPKWGFARNVAELGDNTNKFGSISAPRLPSDEASQEKLSETTKEIEDTETEKEVSTSEEREDNKNSMSF